jgi:hypothetical protein
VLIVYFLIEPCIGLFGDRVLDDFGVDNELVEREAYVTAVRCERW